MDEDQVCPRCKTSKYRNPSMKLMVNVCGHPLCENCVNLLFAKGSGTCPQCDVPLRRNGFRVQLFEDAGVEKDIDIRRRILREFNKQEEEFATLREYNDYLEDVETIIYNLVNGIDVLATNKKIEAYKRDNRESIVRNRARGRTEEDELDEILQMENELNEERAREEQERLQAEKRNKVQKKEALIDELMTSYGDAKKIVASHTKVAEPEAPVAPKPRPKPTQFSSGVRIGGTRLPAVPIVPQDEGEPFVYAAPQLAMDGPAAPDSERLSADGYLSHIKRVGDAERAGGYAASLGCLRALQEGMAGLLFFPGADG
ncbi:CDK-activating kinase assembly factor MAT1-like isoform X2 [Amphibalanus amphitrite]|nr:CDK-activating kinase assembly factor MAT1-like isoform X2 [Amphibalanus amphitrite]XP_043210357.1 CDK-activating kinase assembly factor MAT1-like isoform X2 [Amphibalanus amphitrite]XP_043210358.1 CDK-activating kinase assembly factor MAT1-like isoform X2 [Amphibalanus amphitrite]